MHVIVKDVYCITNTISYHLPFMTAVLYVLYLLWFLMCLI